MKTKMLLSALALCMVAGYSWGQGGSAVADVILGRPTDSSIALNVLATNSLETYCEYGTASSLFTGQTGVTNLAAAVPGVLTLTGLEADTRYYYRLRYRAAGETNYSASVERTFHTQRALGSAFTFSLQGDSHPERVNNMFESAHYSNTLTTAAADRPDFYLTIGDDFSVDTIPTNLINAALVTESYTLQRPYLGLIGHSAPLFLVNGNHEQAAAYMLDGTSNNIAVWAQNARNTYYPQPAPDGFYTGNTNVVPHIGVLRKYFAWTWGDALFVTIDPYWGSPTCADNNYWTGQKRTNLWDVTHGEAQYQWLRKTLEESRARYKFVFAHHVLGTGRGGVEDAPYYEWGGQNGNGTWGFTTNRPTWALPIHQLMASNHVTIFFQGHDHIFARQQLDGVTYLTLPNPADPNYALINSSAFTNCIYKTNNSGYVRLNVSATQVRVDYVRTYLPTEQGPGKTNGMVDYSFTLPTSSNPPPVITSVTSVPAAPFAGNPILITALVTDAVGVASVTLHYSTGTASITNTAFQETMATTGIKNWTGTGCGNPWSVAYAGSNPFDQSTNANYATAAGNTNGLSFKGTASTTNLADNTVTTVNPLNALGDSAALDFYLRASTLSGNAGWALQLNSGAGFITRLSELTGTSHNWTRYHYDLQSSELVSNLVLRFQFQSDPAATNNRVYLDEISLQAVTGGSTWTNVTMELLSNGLYAAQIPAQLEGTIVNYYVTASNNAGLTASYPSAGSGGAASFVVTNAPVTPFDILLGRPTDSSIALSVLPTTNLQILCQYGAQSGFYTSQTAATNVTAGKPTVLTLNSLSPDAQYFYGLAWQQPGETNFTLGIEHTFHTQRGAGESFTFDIEADPHWKDPNAAISPELWRVALTNILADQPDFLMDLGDTFMAEKLGVTGAAEVAQLCLEVRTNQFAAIGHSVPLFLVNGNHEAELGWLSDGTTNNLAVWATQARELYYPCPVSGDFYSGSTNRDGYYAFTWGNALFVVLDPFWFTSPKPGLVTGGWGWTLGTNQYAWLQQTLATNAATFKFVFIHHLVGGSPDGLARGGTSFAPYFEWGGYNTNGTWGFSANRSGWAMPIQDLLLSNNVAAVFHGHDHLFVKQDLDVNNDGIPDLIYQECPQPSATNYNSTGTAVGFGYTNGVLQGSSGHLRVRVTLTQATVEYVRAYLPTDEGPGKTNGMVSYSYVIPAPELPVPRIVEVTRNPTGLLFSWTSLASRDYAVLYKSTLAAPAWTRIATNHSVGTVTTFTDTNAARLDPPQGFYRVMLLP